MNKKIWLVVILLIALGIVAVYFFGIKNKKSTPPNQQQTQTQTQSSSSKKDIPVDQLPKGFPIDMPIPPGAEITQNYESTSTDGRMQSTRVINTQMKADAVLALYKNYFTKLGWKDYSKKGNSMLIMRGQDNALLVSVTNGQTQRTVEITISNPATKK